MEYSVQFSSVAQSCPTLCDPMNRSTPGLPVHHQLPEFTQTHVHRVSDAIQPSHPLSSPSPPAPNPPSIRVFSNESTLRVRWPKYWSFSFSVTPSKEIPGLIPFRSHSRPWSSPTQGKAALPSAQISSLRMDRLKSPAAQCQLHQFSSVQFGRSVVSDYLRPHESQHARPPCSSPSPGVHSDSCPSSP